VFSRASAREGRIQTFGRHWTSREDFSLPFKPICPDDVGITEDFAAILKEDMINEAMIYPQLRALTVRFNLRVR
jgi:hypothetical protein